jgi:hypothetical protein
MEMQGREKALRNAARKQPSCRSLTCPWATIVALGEEGDAK